jgi:integrase
MANLTKRTCDAARYTGNPDRPRRCMIWDEKLRGFGLRIYPTGHKVFVISYRPRDSRVQRLFTIGTFGVLTVDEARKDAAKQLVRVRDGEDPALERRQRRTRGAAAITFGDLATRWLEEYAKPHRKSWREDQRRIEKHLRPALGRLPLAEVTAQDVRPLHARIGRTSPIEANRVVELLRAIYRKGLKWSLVPAGTANPADNVDRFQKREGTRWLSERELARLFRALDREEPETAAIVRLLLLTGARKTEILSARWDQLDIDGRKLRLTGTKSGEERILPLSAEAVDIIRNLPRRLGSPFLFPSPKVAGEPLRDIKREWSRIRKRARLHGVKVHDLRRTTGSALANAGVSLEIIGKALGHRDLRATRVYAHIAQQQATAALDRLGGMLSVVEKARKRARRA